MTSTGYYTKYKKSDKSVYLISVLNLATELQSSEVMFKLFHGLTTCWAKKYHVHFIPVWTCKLLSNPICLQPWALYTVLYCKAIKEASPIFSDTINSFVMVPLSNYLGLVGCLIVFNVTFNTNQPYKINIYPKVIFSIIL